MKKSLMLHTVLFAGNLGLFIATVNSQGIFDALIRADSSRHSRLVPVVASSLEQMWREQARLSAAVQRLETASAVADKGGSCADAEAPGVTVYLDTSQVASLPTSQAPAAQWTAISFKDAGQAADGSKQAVMAIRKTDAPAAASVPTEQIVRWQ